jgi:2-keto-4-pentenoate hydratase
MDRIVAGAVEAYMPAIEIVDERYADWPRTEAATLIADDFFAAGCVLGEPVTRDVAPDLAGLTGQTLIKGVEVARGIGADVMGHPPQRTRMARQQSRGARRGAARGTDRSDREPRPDAMARS